MKLKDYNTIRKAFFNAQDNKSKINFQSKNYEGSENEERKLYYDMQSIYWEIYLFNLKQRFFKDK